MATDTETTMAEQKPTTFGGRLKAQRESLKIERKEAAKELRLNEQILSMIEKDNYPADIPASFIRGYIRSYSKLLQIPEQEINKALESMKFKANPPSPLIDHQKKSVPSSHYFMQFFTYLIFFTVIGLVGVWWYNNANPPLASIINNAVSNAVNAVNTVVLTNTTIHKTENSNNNPVAPTETTRNNANQSKDTTPSDITPLSQEVKEKMQKKDYTPIPDTTYNEM